MSFYIEIQNEGEIAKTHLVLNFNAASKYVSGESFFSLGKYVPVPDKVEVEFKPSGYGVSRTAVEIDVGYDQFKEILLESQSKHTIPSFKARFI
jgi:hypothetical protein